MSEKSNQHSHTLLHIIIVVLIIIAVFAIGKQFIRQEKWNTYVVQSQQNVNGIKNMDSVEDGNMIAATIVSIPANDPLIKQAAALETYIKTLSNQTKRDIVVLDTSRNILADTVAANVGKKYTDDKGSEISKTIGDSIPRYFIEKSTDYPNGVSETVIPIKNAQGATVGALLISTSTIFGK